MIVIQENYKEYIIQIGVFHLSDHLGYKIMIDKPFWMNLRTKSFGPQTAVELTDKAKRYIDEFEGRIKEQIAHKIKKKTGKSVKSVPNLPNGSEWSDYAATESDY